MPAPGRPFTPFTHATAGRSGRGVVGLGNRDRGHRVAVCSTGLIGDRLLMDKLCSPRRAHRSARDTWRAEFGAAIKAAHAIMTTTLPFKQVALHHQNNWTVGGQKSAGMLALACWPPCCACSPPTRPSKPQNSSARLCAAPPRPRSTARHRQQLHSTNDTVLLLVRNQIPLPQTDLDGPCYGVCKQLRARLQASARKSQYRHR